jgi:hypothetical protein
MLAYHFPKKKKGIDIRNPIVILVNLSSQGLPTNFLIKVLIVEFSPYPIERIAIKGRKNVAFHFFFFFFRAVYIDARLGIR